MSSFTPEQQAHLDKLERKRRFWRRYVPIALLGLLLLAAAVVAFRWNQRRVMNREGRRAAAAAWPLLERCLIGEPLAPGEKPQDRLLRIRIASAYASPAIVGKEPHHWPQRCRRFAEDFEMACWRSGLARSCDVSYALHKGDVYRPEELWQTGAKFSGSPPEATSDPTAVAPSVTAAIAPKWTALVVPDIVKSDKVSPHGLTLLFQSILESEKDLLCALGPIDSPDYDESSARCLRIKSDKRLSSSVVDVEKGDHLMLDAHVGRPKILDVDKNEFIPDPADDVWVDDSRGAFVAADGSITQLALARGEYLLWRRAPDGHVEMRRPSLPGSAKLFWDYVVWFDGFEGGETSSAKGDGDARRVRWSHRPRERGK